MEIRLDDLTWHCFKGNEVSGKLLQDVCLFRSCVLFESGFRKNFGSLGKNYGDVQFSDFESYHIIACQGQEILGTIRITPATVETVTLNVLGITEYKNLISILNTTIQKTVEINRLLIDERVRKTNIGRNLVYAAIAVIENTWKRDEMTIIASTGNCTKQTQFALNYTDYEKIPEMKDQYSEAFNDDISFLKYKNPPYIKGSDQIELFKKHFGKKISLPWTNLRMNYLTDPLGFELIDPKTEPSL